MGRNNFASVYAAALATLLMLPGCSIDVKKEPGGEDKQVDIHTLLGGVHVSQQADASEIGLEVYPGARVKEKGSGSDDKSANVNISGFGYGFKVVAVEYESDDAPGKILSFYKGQLKKYGEVLECHTSQGNWSINLGKKGANNSNELSCQGTGGDETELKAGKQDNQHIVAVEPEGKGSSFALVYVRMHARDSEI